MSILTRLKNEPALISAILLAVFNLFALKPETSSQIVTLVSAVLPIILGLLVRQNVDGPVTAERKAEALREKRFSAPGKGE